MIINYCFSCGMPSKATVTVCPHCKTKFNQFDPPPIESVKSIDTNYKPNRNVFANNIDEDDVDITNISYSSIAKELEQLLDNGPSNYTSIDGRSIFKK